MDKMGVFQLPICQTVSKNNIFVRLVNCFEEIQFPSIKVMLSQVTESHAPFTANDICYDKNLTSEQVTELVDLLNEFQGCFTQSTKGIGKTDVLKMKINLSDDSPVVYRPYRLSHSEQKVVRDIVNDLVENNIVRESDSPYASPILLVKKKLENIEWWLPIGL